MCVCDNCATELIDDCWRCGAPVCCPACCEKTSARERIIMSEHHVLTRENNPDIHYRQDAILFFALDWVPKLGDTISLDGLCAAVKVVAIRRISSYWKHNWQVFVVGDVDVIREALTYEVIK